MSSSKKKTKKGYEEVEVCISDKQFLILARMAHEQDITFNQLCNNFLREFMDELDKNPVNRSIKIINKLFKKSND